MGGGGKKVACSPGNPSNRQAFRLETPANAHRRDGLASEKPWSEPANYDGVINKDYRSSRETLGGKASARYSLARSLER